MQYTHDYRMYDGSTYSRVVQTRVNVGTASIRKMSGRYPYVLGRYRSRKHTLILEVLENLSIYENFETLLNAPD